MEEEAQKIIDESDEYISIEDLTDLNITKILR